MTSKHGFALVKREDNSDEQLLRAYARDRIHGEESFKILFDRYFNRVHAHLTIKAASLEVAEDLAQDVFARVVTAAHKFDPNRGSFRAWLFTIAKNLFTDYLRAKGDRRSVPIEECEAELSYLPPQISQLDKHLRGMSPELREPLELSALCGLTASEIAQVLDLPQGTVYSRIHRARLQLRRKLDPHSKIKRIPKKSFQSLPKPERVPPLEIQMSMPYEEGHQND
jgi:RNA polymerase sigma-70 factor (ECF subfamily)